MSSRSKVQGSGFPIFLFPVIGVRRRLISGAVFICVYRRSWRYSHVELGIAQLECLYPTCRSDLGSTGCNGIYPRLAWICLASWSFNVSDFLCVLRVPPFVSFVVQLFTRYVQAAARRPHPSPPAGSRGAPRGAVRSRALSPRAPVFRCLLSPAASWLKPATGRIALERAREERPPGLRVRRRSEGQAARSRR